MALNPIAQNLINYLRQRRQSGNQPYNVGQSTVFHNQTDNAGQSDHAQKPDSSDDGLAQAQIQAQAGARPYPFEYDDDPLDVKLRNLNSDYSPVDLFSSPTNSGQNTDKFDVGSLLQQKLNEYSQLAQQPAQKQNPWAQAAFLGLQALQHGLNPQNNTPVQLLGNAKKARAMSDLRDQITPLLQQQQIQQQTQKFKDDSDYRKAQTALATARPDILQQNADTASQKATDLAKFRGDKLELDRISDKWKEADKAQLRQLQYGKLKALTDRNDELADEFDQKIDELVRHNRATENQAATNEQGANDRFNKGQQVKANLASAKMQFELAMKQYQNATGADKAAAQTEYAKARTAYLKALRQPQ